MLSACVGLVHFYLFLTGILLFVSSCTIVFRIMKPQVFRPLTPTLLAGFGAIEFMLTLSKFHAPASCLPPFPEFGYFLRSKVESAPNDPSIFFWFSVVELLRQ